MSVAANPSSGIHLPLAGGALDFARWYSLHCALRPTENGGLARGTPRAKAHVKGGLDG
jgi:hypothetical protein